MVDECQHRHCHINIVKTYQGYTRVVCDACGQVFIRRRGQHGLEEYP